MDADAALVRDLLEHASDIIQSVDGEGRYLFVNRRWHELLGYSTEELAGLSIFDVVHPDHREPCRLLFAELHGGKELPLVATAFVARDGAIVEVEGRVSVQPRAGASPATIGIFREVGADRRARRRIDDLLRQTRAVIDNAPAGIALYQSTGACVDVNEALARMVGARREDLLAQSFRELESWRRSGLLASALRALEEGGVVETELHFVTSFGVELWLQGRFVPLELGGEPHLLLVADDVTVARRREKLLRSHQRRLAEIHRIVAQVACETTLPSLLQGAIERAVDLVGADLGALVRLDASGRPGDLYSSRYPTDQIPAGVQVLGRGILGRVAAGEVVHTSAIAEEPGHGGLPDWHPRVGPMIGVPVRDTGRVLAMLLVGRGPGGTAFSPEDREIVETFADLSAVAIRGSEQLDELERLNCRLAEQARTDPLMGLGNRRAFEERIEALHQEAQRYGLTYGVVMADVDHFKAYNDRYGHPAGDRVLAALGALLRRAARASDGVFRYGGEEIVIVLPQQTVEGVASAGERFRRVVEEAQLEHLSNTPPVVTMSFGGTAHGPVAGGLDLTWPEVVQRADEALYEAKHAGRNRVVVGGLDPALAPELAVVMSGADRRRASPG